MAAAALDKYHAGNRAAVAALSHEQAGLRVAAEGDRARTYAVSLADAETRIRKADEGGRDWR